MFETTNQFLSVALVFIHSLKLGEIFWGWGRSRGSGSLNYLRSEPAAVVSLAGHVESGNGGRHRSS
jgi:hypothetical protein